MAEKTPSKEPTDVVELLEEDDEFEEFEPQEWTAAAEDVQDPDMWQDGWEDDEDDARLYGGAAQGASRYRGCGAANLPRADGGDGVLIAGPEAPRRREERRVFFSVRNQCPTTRINKSIYLRRRSPPHQRPARRSLPACSPAAAVAEAARARHRRQSRRPPRLRST